MAEELRSLLTETILVRFAVTNGLPIDAPTVNTYLEYAPFLDNSYEIGVALGVPLGKGAKYDPENIKRWYENGHMDVLKSVSIIPTLQFCEVVINEYNNIMSGKNQSAMIVDLDRCTIQPIGGEPSNVQFRSMTDGLVEDVIKILEKTSPVMEMSFISTLKNTSVKAVGNEVIPVKASGPPPPSHPQKKIVSSMVNMGESFIFNMLGKHKIETLEDVKKVTEMLT